MLNLKVMMFLCLSVIVVYCESDQVPINSSAAVESCLLETNMTRDEFEDMLTSPNARELTILKSHAHKCMFGCVMRKNHIVNDGVVSKEVLSKYVLNFYGRPDYKRRLIIKDVEHIVDVCAKKVADESETDECELAATLVTCIVLEANKAGLVDDPARQI